MNGNYETPVATTVTPEGVTFATADGQVIFCPGCSVVGNGGLPVPPPQPPMPPSEGIYLQGVVQTQGGPLNVRSQPGTNFPIVAEIPNGEAVTILSEQNGWYRVVTSNGTYGWVARQFVRFLNATGVVTTQGGNLNMRNGPSVGSPIVGSVPNGTVVEIIGLRGDWYEIWSQGRTGYVSRQFVR